MAANKENFHRMFNTVLKPKNFVYVQSIRGLRRYIWKRKVSIPDSDQDGRQVNAYRAGSRTKGYCKLNLKALQEDYYFQIPFSLRLCK